MDYTNGQAKEISRGCNVGGTETQSQCLGGITGESGISRLNPIIASGENWVWRNPSGSYVYDETTDIGKILQRLELVERLYTEYVRAHQIGLEARLTESKNLEKLFQQSVTELRQEIYNLATEADSNGNGHRTN
ncbi:MULTISPECIES: hypothetical protein [unclassified Nodularia (in: cyanobacteria)]|uniref:hypothetical protein n=1 Tax=unclassified Nodularia (in: cyanobacteria) TaxID=2656917 RepID=UPI001882FB09|nr:MULTISPECIES: hypothetical protein [unclassified Nodularia (in: cyanobacteria)]MBE9199078.1 hypothetical protein [Nodularia sp. LEGE 06071]MCC2694080.1 hypothetical protein [Nodularia sp. LEGE 04288]